MYADGIGLSSLPLRIAYILEDLTMIPKLHKVTNLQNVARSLIFEHQCSDTRSVPLEHGSCKKSETGFHESVGRALRLSDVLRLVRPALP